MKQNINGILLLDKPLHITSNGALQRAKYLFRAKKAGHTGSLDPLASGMLPICFGEATKFSQFLLDSDKWYTFTVQLGTKTTTGDAEGDIVSQRPVPTITREQVEHILKTMHGPLQQIPPMFSAIKHQGKPLYELARQGLEVPRIARTIYIYEFKLNALGAHHLKLSVHCSKGTYVRTLAEDIGEILGCGAHVSELRRPSIQPYHDAHMVTFDELEAESKRSESRRLQSFLLPVDSSVQGFPMVQLSSSGLFYLRTGQAIMVPNAPREGLVRIYSQQMQFLGVGEMQDGRLAPKRLVQHC